MPEQRGQIQDKGDRYDRKQRGDDDRFHRIGIVLAVLLIVAACPVGSNVAVYAQLHGKDYPYAVETVVISTILSILTIPLMMYLSSLLWR